MKRIYACLCIVAVLLGVAFYSSWRVQKFAEDISDDIDDAMEAIRDEDLPSARQALAEGAELCDKMREGMNHLLPHTGLHGTGSRPPRRGRTSRTERPRGSIWGTAPGAGSGGDAGMAVAEACIIKSFRRDYISCNPYYSKCSHSVPVQNQSYKEDFIYSYFALFCFITDIL